MADLLATAALGPATAADTIEIQIALDHWWPTAGTRTTGARNTVPRVVVMDGVLAPLVPTPTRWRFPPPFGEQEMVDVPFSEIVTLHHHLQAREIRMCLDRGSLGEVRDATTQPPQPADAERSAQRFVMEAVVTTGTRRRVARASGRDIYAVTAPLVVEALARALAGDVCATVAAACSVTRSAGGCALSAGALWAPIMLPIGARVSAIRLYLIDNATGPTKMDLQFWRVAAGVQTTIATSAQSSGAGAEQNISVTGLSTDIESGKFYQLVASIATGAASCTVRGAEVDYSMP